MTNHLPMIPPDEDSTPDSKPKLRTRIYKWVIRKLNTLAFHISRFYFWSRLNWILPILAVLSVAYLYSFCAAESWWMKEKVITTVPIGTRVAKASEPNLPLDTVQKIRAAFGNKADTFLKIAMAESGQQSGNKGYNCYYYSNGKRYSDSCKPEDRKNAWSVDCGLLMVNVHGTMCPPEMYDIDYNIKAALGKYERQGFGAWMVCRKKVKCI